MGAVFAKPPLSTQQIMHPSLYTSGKAPEQVNLPPLEKLVGADWTKLDENVMGEFGWKEVLKQFLDDQRAGPLAAAWEGDRYAVFEQKQTKRLLLVARVRLAGEEQAARFFGQYSEALEKKHTERTNLYRRPNFFSFDTPDGGVFLRCVAVECLEVEGTNRPAFDGINRAIGWPEAPATPNKLPEDPSKIAALRAAPPLSAPHPSAAHAGALP